MAEATAPADALPSLWQATAALVRRGGLMAEILPAAGPPAQWAHYPPRDVVNGPLGARWYYHSHDPARQRGREHGHFHLFVARAALPRRVQPLRRPPAGQRPRPATVHIAALSIDRHGLPSRWFATNRWVTGEYLYPATAICTLLPHVDFRGAEGPPLVNAWLTAMLQGCAPLVTDLLHRRDRRLGTGAIDGDDPSVEVAATRIIDLAALG